MLLMTKEQLGRLVLYDPRVTSTSAGASDIRAGLDRPRVLVVLEYLAGSEHAARR